MDKIVGYITVRMNSSRVPKKVIQKVGGSTLVDRGIRTLAAVHDVNPVVVYAHNASQYKKYVSRRLIGDDWDKVMFIDRPAKFDAHTATFNDILDSIIDTPPMCDATYIVYFSVTSPFLTSRAIHHVIEAMQMHNKDSGFVATQHQAFAWYGAKPLYDTRKTPRTQTLPYLILETSGCYIFKRELYKKKKQRIGKDPYVLLVDELHGWDIDTAIDLELAQKIAIAFGW